MNEKATPPSGALKGCSLEEIVAALEANWYNAFLAQGKVMTELGDRFEFLEADAREHRAKPSPSWFYQAGILDTVWLIKQILRNCQSLSEHDRSEIQAIIDEREAFCENERPAEPTPPYVPKNCGPLYTDHPFLCDDPFSLTECTPLGM